MGSVDWLLVVEDDEDTRETLRDVLGDHGYEVVTAANGREALDLLAERPAPLPRLILLDLTMPMMSGWQLATHLQEHHEYRRIPLCILSATAGLAPFGLRSLRKPIDLDLLVTTVAEYFARH